jgi:3',5'-cyclic AMP phosphodiesterase CpdA
MKTHSKALWVTAILLASFCASYAQPESFSFIVLTDTQFGMFTADKDFAQETANFDFAVAAVNRLKPSFVVVLGDLVNKAGDAPQIREYQRIIHKVDPAIPVYHAAGNHDLGNEPTPESISHYRKNFGADHYSFRIGPVYGIVLNSVLIHSPAKAAGTLQEQDIWLGRELEKARESNAEHIMVFQHHPLFLKDPQEPDQYENIPRERRQPLLDLFHKFGIHKVFAGHTHKNVIARDGELEVVASGPVGKPLGKDGSGIRVVTVSGSGIEHRYYDFGTLPERLALIRTSK